MYLEGVGRQAQHSQWAPALLSCPVCPQPSAPLFIPHIWLRCGLGHRFSLSLTYLPAPSCPPSSSMASFFLMPPLFSRAYLLHIYLSSPYPPSSFAHRSHPDPHSLGFPLPFPLRLFPYQPSLLPFPQHIPTAPPIVPPHSWVPAHMYFLRAHQLSSRSPLHCLHTLPPRPLAG